MCVDRQGTLVICILQNFLADVYVVFGIVAMLFKLV